MAVNIGTHFLHKTLSVPSFLPSLPPTNWPSSSSALSRIRISSSSSSSSSPLMDPLTKFKELPFVSAPQRDLMLDLVSALETRLASALLPCSLPPDVQYYQNQAGTAQASLHIRSGIPSSPEKDKQQVSLMLHDLCAGNRMAAHFCCIYCPRSNSLVLRSFHVRAALEDIWNLTFCWFAKFPRSAKHTMHV